MEFLSCNLSVEYPQKIFELGKVTVPDEKSETKTSDEDWMVAVVSHANASFSQIKSDLDAFFMNLGLKWQIEETKHPSFIDGRVGAVMVKGTNVGILGEINPEVLTMWKLENPTVALELNMQEVIKIKFSLKAQ
jgi:phenylalanyl-tRNA synthetase beta chain